MNPLFYYEIEMVPVLIHFFVMIWTWALPVKKIQNPAKSLMAGCCYYSSLAAENDKTWAVAQEAYKKWNRRLFLPNLISSLLLVTAYVWIFHPESFGTSELIAMMLCLLVPITYMFEVRRRTERELKQSFGK